MNLLVNLNYKQKAATRLLIIIVALIAIILAAGNVKVIAIIIICLYYAIRHVRIVFAILKTLQRDVTAGYRFAIFNMYMTYLDWKEFCVAELFQRIVSRHPKKNAFVMGERSLTFEAVSQLSNRIAGYFKQKGLQHGDCVALIMETCPEYVCIWLGLSHIGVVTALININQRRETLIHSIKAAQAKAIIVSDELAPAVMEIMQNETIKPQQIYQFTNDADAETKHKLLETAIDLAKALKEQPCTDLTADMAKCKPKHKLLYVFTSGTTGLPKAAVITNQRFFFIASGAYTILAISKNDVIYNALPLYHSSGGLLAIGNTLMHGVTVVLRKKFSASNFWKDCIRHNCTAAIYIGELCRYLLNTPQQAEDTQHKVQHMFGNGLRATIWEQFVYRFNIPRISEFYGSTEGNSNLVNISSQVGAVGFIPLPLSKIFPVQLIKCDEETGEPLRDVNGYCIRCEDGETGLLIGRVNMKHAITNFSGYVDKTATEKKLLKNVFIAGDVYFNSGDMVVRDLLGFIYFKDRTGDTFRWRGENVSTLEVEAIITNVIGLQDCVVYGVEIPYVEGKAGMAAIADPEHKLDIQHLSVGIRGSLPVYAQPLFLRIMHDLPRTSTYKLKKRELLIEGYDIHKIKDPIYYLNKDGTYKALTSEQLQLLRTGKAGL